MTSPFSKAWRVLKYNEGGTPSTGALAADNTQYGEKWHPYGNPPEDPNRYDHEEEPSSIPKHWLAQEAQRRAQEPRMPNPKEMEAQGIQPQPPMPDPQPEPPIPSPQQMQEEQDARGQPYGQGV